MLITKMTNIFLLTCGDQVHSGAVTAVCSDGTGVDGTCLVDIS